MAKDYGEYHDYPTCPYCGWWAARDRIRVHPNDMELYLFCNGCKRDYAVAVGFATATLDRIKPAKDGPVKS